MLASFGVLFFAPRAHASITPFFFSSPLYTSSQLMRKLAPAVVGSEPGLRAHGAHVERLSLAHGDSPRHALRLILGLDCNR